MLQFVSRDTGKPTIAAVADSLLRSIAHQPRRRAKEEAEEFSVSIPDIEAILEGDKKRFIACDMSSRPTFNQGARGYKAPDLTIVHHVTVPRAAVPTTGVTLLSSVAAQADRNLVRTFEFSCAGVA